MADWFYGKEGSQHGPISELEISTLVASGQIDATTVIWREGMTDWLPVNQVPEFQSATTGGQMPAVGAVGTNPYNSPQTYAGQTPYTGVPVPTDTLSIVSLVCGILAILASCMYIGVIFGIPAVICGHMSLKNIKHSPIQIQGKGMAIAGLVCGYIGSLISIALIILVFGMIGMAAMEGSSSR